MYKFSDIKKTHTVAPKKQIIEKINESSSLLENVRLTDVEKFFSKLFESREIAHIHHLQTRGHGAPVPVQHLSGGRVHPKRGAARQVHRQCRQGGEPDHLLRPRGARDPCKPRRAHAG